MFFFVEELIIIQKNMFFFPTLPTTHRLREDMDILLYFGPYCVFAGMDMGVSVKN